MCPACPHPGKNLPSGWENSPPGTRWLYALFIAIDANFRLKRKAVSSDKMNPGFNAGWAYFVEEKAYKAYLSDTCVSHNAVNMADTKSSRGLAATGIGTVNCARHEFKLPNGVGDLQKGERYLNMDYLVFSTLVGFTVTMLNISYNIACRTLKRKMEEAVKWEREHCAALYDLEATVRPTLLEEWGLEVQLWEEDNAHPNPFESKVAPITQAAVRSQLADWKQKSCRKGSSLTRLDVVSPSVLISGGIELEDMQQRLKCDIANLSLHPQTNNERPLFTGLMRYRDFERSTQASRLPTISSIGSLFHQCHRCLMEYEWELWWAQAHDALHNSAPIFVYARTCTNSRTSTYVAKQHPPCAQNLIASVEAKKDAAADKYKCARQALGSLSSHVDKVAWEEKLRPLRHKRFDPWVICRWPYSGYRNNIMDLAAFKTGVHIEWCKARARAARWSEEVELLAKEMQRVLAFLEWQGHWWSTVLHPLEKITEQEGLRIFVPQLAVVSESVDVCNDDSGPSIDAPPMVMDFEE
ncbi:uncharacterized protein EDB93DRAFT_1250523 [Suillus bovinus]|uniref:uncharacterized protein n=1 Tax=Suillus bovinus TaxID=48563 RepID=UPI001B884DEC|nr:uncharacterized protein EDB93DRAFT_1250523 [Suillus bovinus]KAG2147802.1 hypothetical protein EDB93DRAFT_1250523 [Suillus bovinus]